MPHNQTFIHSCMISEKNVYTLGKLPSGRFKIYIYRYIVSLFAQTYKFHTIDIPSFIKYTYMKYTFICRFHVIYFKLKFCNYFIFFSSDVISLLLSPLQFLFCRSYICKL